MASLFDNDPSKKDPPSAYSRERIESEIAHLRKGKSTRQGKGEKYAYGWFLIGTVILLIILLYVMDPLLYGYYKGDAIRAYLYLHTCGSDKKAKAVADCGLLSPSEIDLLNQRLGNFQSYYETPQQAEQKADNLVDYMQGVRQLQEGKYDELDWIGKIRYTLFVRIGLLPPIKWRFLTPSVEPS